MLKKIFLFSLSLFLMLSLFAQDVKKIGEQFQKDLADTVNYPYGNNKAAGKYYNIRGFKM